MIKIKLSILMLGLINPFNFVTESDWNKDDEL